ncbi:general secretion pathway protein GspK [Polyangium spumosum]|uniref:General secretion pathway protein GspK n=1 Tax=Polyangium spumosum TaxID=889282 RepID=A0A6N7PPT8_9BACT|nr:type II secretion system protein GspK [Polyangium spumosum]MRG93959.1 general secretion pathway protein GspK [Polyangium spumosum]
MRVSATPKRKKKRRKKDERGIALLMVLGAITVLTVFLTELQQETTAELASAIADRDSLKAEYLAKSAINLSRLLIASEQTVRPTITQGQIGMMLAMLTQGQPGQIPIWENANEVLGLFNDQTGADEFVAVSGMDISTGKNLGVSGGRFDFKIVDEDGKINLNVAASGSVTGEIQMVKQLASLMSQKPALFEQMDADGQVSDLRSICGAIIDWADPNEQAVVCDPLLTGPGGSASEDNFYQTIGLPYRRKNAAFDSLEELRLVRGIGDDFWANLVEPDSGRPESRIVTVWGQGKLNVNSAPAEAMLTVICAHAVQAATPMCNPLDPTGLVFQQGFVGAVSAVRSFVRGIPLFSKPAQFRQIIKGQGMLGQMIGPMIGPVVFQSDSEFDKSITTSSKVLSIYAEGVVPGRKRTTRVRIHAVIDTRQPPQQMQPGGPAQASPFANPAGNIVHYRIE